MLNKSTGYDMETKIEYEYVMLPLVKYIFMFMYLNYGHKSIQVATRDINLNIRKL